MLYALQRLRHSILWLTAAVLLFGSVAPSLTTFVGKHSGTTWVEVCTTEGTKLVALESGEDSEQHGIHTVLPAPCEDLGGVALNRVALAVIGGYAVEAGRQRPDAACGGHLTHTVQR